MVGDIIVVLLENMKRSRFLFLMGIILVASVVPIIEQKTKRLSIMFLLGEVSIALHIDNMNKKKTWKKEIGFCPVDSGQIMLVDPCYLKKWKDGDYTGKDDDNDYARACEVTLGEESAGQTFGELAVVSSTGFGDGKYPVVATYEDNGDYGVRIKKLEIKFF